MTNQRGLYGALVLGASVAALGGGMAMAEPTQYPVTYENCGHSITFDAAPESVVSVGQAATEILYALGLGDKVSGTSVWFTEVLPEFKAINDQVERLNDDQPSFESVVGKRPGLVAVQFEWHVGPFGVVATREQFHDLSIPTYILPADCVGKDNEVGVDGTREELLSTEVIYQGITELAEIFDVQERGVELVAELRAREEAAIAEAAEVGAQDVSAVFWFSSAAVEADPWVAGQKGSPGYMMTQLGIENIAQSDEEWPVVGWETIARADPTMIVIARMDRRRFPTDDYQVKLDFLKSDPVTSQMSAVKNDRIVLMDAHAMDANMRTIFGIEALTKAIVDLGLGS